MEFNVDILPVKIRLDIPRESVPNEYTDFETNFHMNSTEIFSPGSEPFRIILKNVLNLFRCKLVENQSKTLIGIDSNDVLNPNELESIVTPVDPNWICNPDESE